MKNIARFLGIIVLIALCGFTACDEAENLIPGRLTVENDPEGTGTVTIYTPIPISLLNIGSVDPTKLEIKAATTGSSPYTLFTDEGTVVFTGTGNYWVCIQRGSDLKFTAVYLNNGNGKIDYNNMKPLGEFLTSQITL